MSSTPPFALGIETSCDDTAAAVVAADGAVLASAVSSQLEAHRPFGGVVPEIASREHLVNWPAVSAEAFERSGVDLSEIELVAATAGPGLIGALLVGLSLGRSLAFGLGKPFFAIHHLEAHLFSPFLKPRGEPAAKPPEKFVGLVVSGGHTSLYEVEQENISTVAETRDDAIGEVFDKIGKRLGLRYPQGPRVDQLAEGGRAEAFPMAVAKCSDGSLEFSYSGLKTQTLVKIERCERKGLQMAQNPVDDVCDAGPELPHEALDLLAGFRAAAVAQLLDRLGRLFDLRPFETLAVSGGVAANRLLRRQLPDWSRKRGVDLRLVPLDYSGDNAAMIAYAAQRRYRHGGAAAADDPLTAEAGSRLSIG